MVDFLGVCSSFSLKNMIEIYVIFFNILTKIVSNYLFWYSFSFLCADILASVVNHPVQQFFLVFSILFVTHSGSIDLYVTFIMDI
jgi:hypothetical protein